MSSGTAIAALQLSGGKCLMLCGWQKQVQQADKCQLLFQLDHSLSLVHPQDLTTSKVAIGELSVCT